jgi:hypothetical protein
MSQITAQAAIQRVTDTLYAPVRYTGTGSPEGVVTSEPGWLYLDTLNERTYVKQTGTGNTGWNILTSSRFIGSCAIPTVAGFANKTSVTHGFSRMPDAVTPFFFCVGAENGYSIGDRVCWNAIIGAGTPGLNLVWMLNSTTIDVVWNGAVLYVPNKSTGVFGAVTSTNWLCYFSAQIFPV